MKEIRNQLELGFAESHAGALPLAEPLADQLSTFNAFGTPTRSTVTTCRDSPGITRAIPTYVNEFWTAKQRAANSLHEISYRACFKPQLPRFFIERLTQPGEVVYDPFMGRGTTLLEAALLGRIPFGNDMSPLSLVLARPRLNPPAWETLQQRLAEIPFAEGEAGPEELLVFYHPDTLREIIALRHYLFQQQKKGPLDAVDEWIAMVALNRLTGHSPGFFSVYTLPPNQAVSIKSQLKINARRSQVPPRRDVPAIILKKSRQLLGDCDALLRRTLDQVAPRAVLMTGPADHTPQLPDASVALVVTSPPFLDVVDYATDNWLRCWFLGIDATRVPLTVPGRTQPWQTVMRRVFHELNRVLKAGGHIAFEVGEVHRGQTKLEEIVLPAGMDAGLEPVLVLINDQKFTKTANCWGVSNNRLGTNTNRVVVFQKPK
jgi:hypothetical protein